MHNQNFEEISIKQAQEHKKRNKIQGQRPRFDSKHEKLWALMQTYISEDKHVIQSQICNHVEFSLARTRFSFDSTAAYMATALSVRDRLIEAWNDSHQILVKQDPKRLFYLSVEWLLGRLLQNTLLNIDLVKSFKEALMELGFQLEQIYDLETEPALGNGGLGRLAACFLDSAASNEYPV